MLDDLALRLTDKIKHTKINGPVFLNEDDSTKRLEVLNDLLKRVGDDQREAVENEIRLIEIGKKGEENVIYELKHSKENMLILHDITLMDSYKDSQIDFLLITRKAIIVLETKKLSGDIEINSDGDFIRYYKNLQGKVYKKEGIYSPITQNQYHIDAVRDLLLANNLIKKLPFYSLVVIANSKTIINKTYAKKAIKEQIIKYDQLNQTISRTLAIKNDFDLSDKRITDIADLIIANNEPREYNYIEKLHLNIIEDEVVEDIRVIDEPCEATAKDDRLYEALRKYRFTKAKELNYKPYYIFNDKQLELLVLKRPATKEEFMSIPGFAEGKYNLYGDDIIKLIEADSINSVDEGVIERIKEEMANEPKLEEPANNDINIRHSDDRAILERRLKAFRMSRSTAENIKPYMIFNNAQMEDLLNKMPKTKEELLKVNGFGEVKAEKYGDEILKILN